MIKSKDDIQELLEDYFDTQEESRTYYVYKKSPWNAERIIRYQYGISFGKYLEKDSATLRILEYGVNDNIICAEIKESLELRKKESEKKAEEDILFEEMFEGYSKQLLELSKDPIEIWIRNNCRWAFDLARNLPDSKIKILVYLKYAFENYYYQEKHPLNNNTSRLEAAYNSFMDENSPIDRYKLVPIDGNRELLFVDSPCIYEKNINKSFYIKNLPENLCRILVKLKSLGMINELSVRLENSYGYKGRMDIEYLAEQLERGKVFDFAALGNVSVSKLYSQNYHDCLWIVIDSKNMTFEELCDDFLEYKDMVVTQVVHLQYFRENDKYYISHIDHEYIFYTADEYSERIQNHSIKGMAKPRMKSFKIDNSKIPFDYRCKNNRKNENGRNMPSEDIQFLCYVLECYFVHKDLLKEYFQKISQ